MHCIDYSLWNKHKLRPKLPFHDTEATKVKEMLAIVHDILEEIGRTADRQGG